MSIIGEEGQEGSGKISGKVSPQLFPPRLLPNPRVYSFLMYRLSLVPSIPGDKKERKGGMMFHIPLPLTLSFTLLFLFLFIPLPFLFISFIFLPLHLSVIVISMEECYLSHCHFVTTVYGISHTPFVTI